MSYQAYSIQSGGFILAGPTGTGTSQPTFRLLVSGDIPNITSNQINNYIVGILGETVSGNSIVFKDIFNQRHNGSSRWYYADNASTGIIRFSPIFGICLNSGNSGNSVNIQTINGIVSGYSNLVADSGIWLGISGGIIQSQPNIPTNNTQVAIINLGFSISSSSFIFNPVRPKEITVLKLCSGLALYSLSSIEHFPDFPTRTRNALAYSYNKLVYPLSLITYYPMEEGSGSIIDIVNGNNGTPINSPTWQSGSLPPLHLTNNTTSPSLASASSQYYSVTNWVNSLNTNKFTISLWINPTTTSSSTTLFGNYANPNGFVLGFDDAGSSKLKFYTSSSTTLLSTNTIATGVWQNIIVTMNTNTANIYVNGTGNGSASGLSLQSTGGGNNNIGNLSTTTQYYNGKIKEFRFYNSVLTTIQIANLASGYNEDGSTQPYVSSDCPVQINSNTLTTNGIFVKLADPTGGNSNTITTFFNNYISGNYVFSVII